MHIQTHKQTVPAPGFASLCVCLQCVCNLCHGGIVCLEMCCRNICIECLCVAEWHKKKSHRCHYGTFPKCLVVNCCGLVFGKQPNKLTLPVGQWRSAKQHSLGGPTQGTEGYRWQRRRMHTPCINGIQITTLMSSCSAVKITILSTLTHTHTQTNAWTHCCVYEAKGGEPIRQVKEAPQCSFFFKPLLLLCVCLCVDDRGLHSLCRTKCLQNTFPHKHIYKKQAHTFPSTHSRGFGFVGRVSALLSDNHLFYLGWQSCLINWILNKPSQKTFISGLLLSLCVYEYKSLWVWIRFQSIHSSSSVCLVFMYR